MKGLDWIVVASDIAFDDDIEHVSDGAFRTYIELVGISAFRLSDGVVRRRDATKLCNTRRLTAALDELSAAGFVTLDDENIIIPAYAKWQKTRADVEKEREAYRERKQRSRGGSHAVTPSETPPESPEVRVEKSRVEKKKRDNPPAENGGALVAFFVDECRDRGRVFTQADKGKIARYVGEVLDQGAPFAVVRAAITKMLDKNLGPHLLGQLVNECKAEVPVDPLEHEKRIRQLKAQLEVAS